ncbi:MAG TPA: hypothetical protein VGR93_04825 [Candidatus Acidoferrales bacterium]|nr:hypothetical protein [Candidatus Acidoferrales bacterium]
MKVQVLPSEREHLADPHSGYSQQKTDRTKRLVRSSDYALQITQHKEARLPW